MTESNLNPSAWPAPPLSPFPRPRRLRSGVWLNLVLFLITLLTTMFAGTYLAHFDSDFHRFWIELRWHQEFWLSGLPFAVTLLSILLAHEFGHYLLSRHHGVECSLPYFLPGPNLVGTFGAIIFMKGRILNRRQLFDIGAAGPLCGFVVAVFAMALGFALAKVRVVDLTQPGQNPGLVMFSANFLLSRAWAIYSYLHPGLMAEPVLSPDGRPVIFSVLESPLLDAACVGFLVTALNLLPIGQLDGGHVAYAALGPKSSWLSWIMICVLIAAGVFFWPAWAGLGVLLLLLMIFSKKGFRHPPPLDPYSPLGWGRRFLAVLILLIFLAILSPVPVNVIAP